MQRTQMLLTMLVGVGVALAGADQAEAQKRQRDVITLLELEQTGKKAQDLYQAIRSLRPHFLQPPRGTRTMGSYTPDPTVVYVDGLRTGDLETLKTISTQNVFEVRYFEPSKAQEEFGMNHSGGAVLVRTMKSRPVEKPDSGKPDNRR